MLAWLEKQGEFPKLFWQDRDTEQVTVAAGAEVETCDIPKTPSRPYFGGTSFSKQRKETLWKPFPSTYFFAPKVMRTGKIESFSPFLLKPLKRIDTPDLSQWKKTVSRALKSRELGKVVLGRRTTLLFEKPIDPLQIVRLLLSNPARTTVFCLQLSPTLAFVGSTPEKLYVREKNRIVAEALAGTVPLKKGRHGEKERLEFSFVKEAIHTDLSSLCTAHFWEKERLVKTPFVRHLYSRFSGTLKQPISDADLVRLLHPTPATAGFPRTLAIQHIEEREPFERGWYAAPIGWITSDGANFAVALRSALINGKEMHLFAGCGIVKGSNAIQEWEELNLKMRGYIHE